MDGGTREDRKIIMIEFLNAIRNHGLNPPDHIPLDVIIRFPGKGKRNGNTDGWAILFPDMCAGVFGDYASGLKEHWKSGGVDTMTEGERVNFDAIIESHKQKAKEEEKEKHEKAALHASEFIQALPPAPNSHPYLKRKKVKAHGLLADGDILIIPLHDKDGNLTSYQTIDKLGNKKLLKGGQKKGCAFFIPGNNDKVFIVEGYATGASVHEATECAVIVAIDAGNLFAVVDIAITKGYKQVIIAADNDHGKEKNTGIEAAKTIKEKHPQIDYIYPPEINGKPTDWNDYAIAHGAEAARKLLMQDRVFITSKDLVNVDVGLSLKIPPEIYESSPLISLGVRAVSEVSSVTIIQYILPSVLAHISTAIAEKIRIHGDYASCFFVRVGSTGTSKSEVDKYFKAFMSPHFRRTTGGKNPRMINTFYGATQFASGAALLNHVSNNKGKLIIIDEIKNLIASGIKGNANDAGMKDKVEALLTIATGGGRPDEEKAYAKDADNVHIESMCANLYGNATTDLFDSLTEKDLTSGLLRRFEFFAYDGDAQFRDNEPNENSEYAAEYLGILKRLHTLEVPDRHEGKGEPHYLPPPPSAINIGFDTEAGEYRKQLSREIIIEGNKERKTRGEGASGLIYTLYNSTLRYALIYHAENPDKIFEPLTVHDLKRGYALARMLAGWKLTKMIRNISSGEFHYHCNEFINALKSCIKSGKPATLKTMKDRKAILKNLSDRELLEIEKTLIADETIHVVTKSRNVKHFELLKE